MADKSWTDDLKLNEVDTPEFRAGWAAFRASAPYTACPHLSGHERLRWQDGWLAAADEAVGEDYPAAWSGRVERRPTGINYLILSFLSWGGSANPPTWLLGAIWVGGLLAFVAVLVVLAVSLS